MQTFDIDLADGQLGESEFIKQLLTIGNRGEHKRDRQAIASGRVALEFEHRNPGGRITPSGVYAGSDVFIVEIPQTKVRLTMPTTHAQDLCELAKAAGLAAWIGSEGASHCGFVPFDWFLYGGPAHDR